MQTEKLQVRSMTKYVLLRIFTGGIYQMYFYYKLSLDVEAVCEGDGVESSNYLVKVLLNVLTFGLYSLYWNYKLGQRLYVNAPRYGFKMMESGRDILILKLLSNGMISAYELIKNMNRIAQVYNQNGLMPIV